LGVQGGDGHGDERDGPFAARRFGFTEPAGLTRDFDQLFPHLEPLCLDADGRPLQAERLADAQTGGEHDGEEMLELVAGGSVQECLCLLRGERLRLFDARPRCFGERNHVALQELPFFGAGQCSSKDRRVRG
jgi:hypothetical protein